MSVTNGSRLGPDEIVEFIGAGGRGEVYRARATARTPSIARQDTLMSVAIRTSPTLDVGTPQLLSNDTCISDTDGPARDGAPSDGERFVVVKPAEGERVPHPVHFVDNWFEELRRRVPARR